MARIAIDARISRSWSTGVGVYTLRLLEALGRLTQQHRFLLLTAAEAPQPPLRSELPIEQRSVHYPTGGAAQHLLLPRVLRSLGVDLLLVTHPASAPLWAPCPRLIFAHDLIPLVLPRFYGLAKRLYYRTIVRWSLRAAQRVLVDSESTRWDCQLLLGLPPDRLRVVYGGVSERYRAGGRPAEEPSRPYLLYVGNKRPHKNVDRLIEAFDLLLRDGDPGCDLLIAGRDEPGDIETDGRRLRTLAERLRLDGRVQFLGEVSEQELHRLYRGALAFVSLSQYEGFGLPPLEAMACGTPVVALKAGSLPEVVGDGGVLLETAEPAAVAGALRSVLSDAALRRELAERAVRQAARFSWDKTARAVLEEIEDALGQRSGR